MQLQIENMTCGGCARGVTAAIKDVDADAIVEIDLPAKRVRIESAQPAEHFARALDEAGFPAQQTP
ncbi:conserved hypothetical protein [uncultured Stenotrophomonas sp.]|uniref:HMA domain-containing protein n=1 Tax=uncultured Stenotrophomonas sp. TaxID=165438 RepID=A0A1Y5Q6P8_9GAMM|nr:conserved hypothetical protein [uncultured Stenotrophomonas sp.]